MRTITREELDKILENHKHWLTEDCEGWKELNADLRNADLYGADLSNADLRYADLRNANLRNANLSNADLYGADLSDAELRNADLRNADLCNADLCNAHLSGADLYGADLRNADLYGADLSDANLSDANLSNANLYGAHLRNAENIPYVPMVCPEEDEFIGWKKADSLIVKLLIPSDAKRSSSTTRKCRCSKAKVLEIYNLGGTIAEEREVKSNYDSSFIYKVGETVEVADFDENRWKECTKGIHFFMQRKEAIDYDMC